MFLGKERKLEWNNMKRKRENKTTTECHAENVQNLNLKPQLLIMSNGCTLYT
jgi:hypothetical protein